MGVGGPRAITCGPNLDLLLHPLSFSPPSWTDVFVFIGPTFSPGGDEVGDRGLAQVMARGPPTPMTTHEL